MNVTLKRVENPIKVIRIMIDYIAALRSYFLPKKITSNNKTINSLNLYSHIKFLFKYYYF